MQHWWKWLLGPSIACGALLLIGSMSLMCNTANNPSSHFAGINYAEAAVPTDPSDGIITRVAGYSATYWPRWSTPATAIVPIVSVGTPGLRLGLAQVTGPKREVGRVKAVLQLDADFKSVRMKILVPSDSYTDLRRVQGTAVTGLVQYKLLD
ncbi:MAG TPA: hypothetical protein VHV83_09600, partial [Armatimonadota bacterium]|nr:hypothetical protein [Armatimonadota bacterium]